ncbi:hypothetical protein [Clostridium baratii]|uniref:hypothetical protein n=1 Tax=Clostridium baratii TaxID=1561 RepID=UPI001CC48469|nr:hypothetical protein [Clostridium baratii]
MKCITFNGYYRGSEWNWIFKILIVSVIAGIVGSTINYLLGYYFGDRAISYIERRFPKTRKSINASYNWLNK